MVDWPQTIERFVEVFPADTLAKIESEIANSALTPQSLLEVLDGESIAILLTIARDHRPDAPSGHWRRECRLHVDASAPSLLSHPALEYWLAVDPVAAQEKQARLFSAPFDDIESIRSVPSFLTQDQYLVPVTIFDLAFSDVEVSRRIRLRPTDAIFLAESMAVGVLELLAAAMVLKGRDSFHPVEWSMLKTSCNRAAAAFKKLEETTSKLDNEQT